MKQYTFPYVNGVAMISLVY